MAVFEGDKLRPEESLGGFEPGQAGDDTFYLEQTGEYPGEMPDYEVMQIEEAVPIEQHIIANAEPETEIPIEEPVIEQEEIIAEEPTIPESVNNPGDAELIETPDDGLVWDLFEDKNEPATEETLTEAEPEEQEPVVLDNEGIPEEAVQIDFDYNTIKPLPEDRLDNLMNPPVLDTADAFVQEPEEDVMPEPIQEPIAEAEPIIQNTPEEPVDELDKELLNLLSNDIDVGKKKREDKASTVVPTVIPTGDFTPIEEGTEIDLSGMEANHPSTFNLEASVPVADPVPVPETPKEEKKAKEQKIKVKKEKAPKEPKEKKERNKIFPLIAMVAAAMLILAVLGGGSYYLFVKPGNATKAIKGMMAKKEKKEDKSKLAHKPKTEHKTEPKHESPKVAAHPEAPKTEEPKHEIAKVEEPKAEVMHEAPKVEEHKAEAKHETAKATEHKTESKHETAKVEPKHVVKTDAKKKTEPKEIAEAKPTKHKKAKKQIAKVKVTETDKKELYTVQIYTTPSRDDAEEWLKKLRKKSISSSYIVSSKVRDKIWYRVRFGYFDSHDKAKTEAMKYGFAQTWIDRIR